MPENRSRLGRTLRLEIKRRFDLLEDKASNQEIIDSIESSVEFRGANLWILVFAIILASIGLDTNSAAVIIGAMLISPLMGPIMGLGLGIAIADFDLVKRSFKSLMFATASAVAASTLYFLLSPLSSEGSELLARTNPTIWDVLIAFSGGLAGIIASSRKVKTNVIPGVAIATALMPPLCTLGYGLANANLSYAFGAAYLFFINSVFICFSTILICRLLRLPQKEYLDIPTRQKFRQWIGIIVVIAMVPSIYMTYRIVKRSIIERNVALFIDNEILSRDCQVIDRKVNWDTDPPQIVLSVVGQPISPEEIDAIKQKLVSYNLKNEALVIKQALSDLQKPQDITALKSAVLKDFYDQANVSLKSKDEKIALLESELARLKTDQLPEEQIFQELKAYQPDVMRASFAKTSVFSEKDGKSQPTLLAYVEFSSLPSLAAQRRIENWLTARTQIKNVTLMVKSGTRRNIR